MAFEWAIVGDGISRIVSAREKRKVTNVIVYAAGAIVALLLVLLIFKKGK